MEEGPEPQELFEQAEKSHHETEHGHGEAKDSSDRKKFTTRSAITASVLAVGAALASLLSGHAANDAIVKTIKASDSWGYFQAKSTKQHIFEGNRQLVETLGGEKLAASLKSHAALEALDKKLKQYDEEKKEIQVEAKKLDDEATLDFAKHQQFSISVACLQIGIVLASVAIITTSRWLYYESVAAGIAGIVFVVMGILMH